MVDKPFEAMRFLSEHRVFMGSRMTMIGNGAPYDEKAWCEMFIKHNNECDGC
jgi:hypothetical protein